MIGGIYYEVIVPLVRREPQGNLEQIRQIPGMHSIVTAVYDVPVGEGLGRESPSRG